jgi:hypothetical protein
MTEIVDHFGRKVSYAQLFEIPFRRENRSLAITDIEIQANFSAIFDKMMEIAEQYEPDFIVLHHRFRQLDIPTDQFGKTLILFDGNSATGASILLGLHGDWKR